MLKMTGICKAYRSEVLEIFALRDLSIHVREGEFIAVTGRRPDPASLEFGPSSPALAIETSRSSLVPPNSTAIFKPADLLPSQNVVEMAAIWREAVALLPT
jgi:hypothetical protein